MPPRDPRPVSAIDTQALYGEAAMLYDDHEGGGSVRLARDGYVGCLSMTALGLAIPEPTDLVAANRSFVDQGPDMRLPPIEALPLDARVAVCGANGVGHSAQIGLRSLATH